MQVSAYQSLDITVHRATCRILAIFGHCERGRAERSNLVVQAAQIGENTLKEWINKSDIPFPVSVITAVIEKAPFTWGVRSLPWLILTDRRHIVTAEGFGLDELDAQIGHSNESQSRRP